MLKGLIDGVEEKDEIRTKQRLETDKIAIDPIAC